MSEADRRRAAAYGKVMGKGSADAPPVAGAKSVAGAPENDAVSISVKGAAKAGGGLAKTTLPPKVPQGLEKTAGEADGNFRKVAKFLVLVGKDEAAKILARLDPAQIEKVAAEIAHVGPIGEAEAQALLDEFRTLFHTGITELKRSSGGVQAARDILTAAFGPEKGETILNRTVAESRENPFAFLEDLEGEHIALLLKDEAPLTIALVLSRVSASKAAATIKVLEGERRLETLRRMAHLDKVAPEVLERVAAALRDRARSVSRPETSAVDGRHALAEILKRTDSDLGERLLSELSEADPELGKDLEEKLYTLDDVLRLDDKPLQTRLHGMDNRTVALLLKGKRPAFVEKVLSNVSQTRRAVLAEELEIMGPVPKRDVEQVTRDFMAWFRAGRENGSLFLLDDDDVLR